MALKLGNSGREPLGLYDCADGEIASFKGGEVCSFTYTPTEGQPGVSQVGLDEAAYDQFDGYVQVGGAFKRPIVSKNWNGTVLSAVTTRPLFLSDDGIFGYGTLFGTVVGATVGQTSYGATTVPPASALLGPSSATGSGKMTLWDKPGTYAVTLDNVDPAASTGLVPTNTTLQGGDSLYFTSAGLLTPNSANSAQSASVKVGHFIEFNTNGSLVTTPNYLVAALNSPSGNVSSLQARSFTLASFYFWPTAP